MHCAGVDVSKYSLDCAFGGQVRRFANTEEGIAELALWALGAQGWCLEATGRHHLRAAARLSAFGRCLVVNPGLARKYLGFVGGRAKTDRIDALGLARLGEREGENLREFRPVDAHVQRTRDLLSSRRALVDSRSSLGQLAEETGDPGGHLKASMDSMTSAIKDLDKEVAQAMKAHSGAANLKTVPGIGPLSAAMVACTLERGDFPAPDSLVAYAGLDPRPHDSGRHKGRRRLSRQGDAELRRVLFMAARSGARTDEWKPYYESQLAKGLSKTEATVILARKLLRVCWKVYRQDGPFISNLKTDLDKKP
jgi:transposase